MVASGVFEGVFASRCGKAEASAPVAVEQTNDTAGAFEDVFVRRGRWRKASTSQRQSDVVHLAECVASGTCDAEYNQQNGLSDTTGQELKIMDPIQESSDPMLMTEITDDIQLVVKNTFLTTASLVRNSLTKFLSERLVQSCPAGSIDIDDILGADDVGDVELAADDVIMNTALTWQQLRTMSFDDASFMLDELCQGEAFNTASTFGDDDVVGMQAMIPAGPGASGEGVVYNTGLTLGGDQIDQTIFDRVMLTQDRLNTLRMAGTNIQQRIVEEAAVPAINPALHFVAVGSCFPPPPNVFPSVSASTMPVPPPPPPFETAPVALPSAVLRLADALPPPELGGHLAPSVGSLLHHKGECRPCTFFHTRGCQNKETCEFCHLCAPGEKKKRLRAEKSCKRHAQIAAVANARAILASLDAAEANGEVDFIVE